MAALATAAQGPKTLHVWAPPCAARLKPCPVLKILAGHPSPGFALSSAALTPHPVSRKQERAAGRVGARAGVPSVTGGNVEGRLVVRLMGAAKINKGRASPTLYTGWAPRWGTTTWLVGREMFGRCYGQIRARWA